MSVTERQAVIADVVFDGTTSHRDAAVIIEGAEILAVTEARELPGAMRRRRLSEGAWLAPGFIDVQVNGGGGVMLNDHPDVASLETICKAHAPFGTTALLPTLITDTPDVTAAAIAAGGAAMLQKVTRTR